MSRNHLDGLERDIAELWGVYDVLPEGTRDFILPKVRNRMHRMYEHITDSNSVQRYVDQLRTYEIHTGVRPWGKE